MKIKYLFFVLAIGTACTNDYYTVEDFRSVQKVDTHMHLNSDNAALVEQATADSFLLVTVNVDAGGTHIDEQERFARIHTQSPKVVYMSTFGMGGWPSDAWRDSTLARIGDSFAHGALGIKIWKNIGIVEKDSAGNFIMVDHPAFDPIAQLVIDNDKTLLGHLGEPKNCWLPLGEMTVNNDRNYFETHPEYHMYLHPEYPAYDTVIAARDRFLKRHPNLRFVGAHLGSLEWNLDELAKRLDQFPNMAVDVAARIPHLQYLTQQDRDKVRTFFDRYQDRIIYATDSGIRPDSDPAEAKESLHNTWVADWKYFVTDETLSSPNVNGEFRGLKLKKPIIDKVFRENAIRWFRIKQD